jgi:hypothetical protein
MNRMATQSLFQICVSAVVICCFLFPNLVQAIEYRATATRLNLTNCTQDTSSSCYTKKTCQKGDIKLDFYINPQNNKVFEFVATSHHYVKPEMFIMGSEYESDLRQAREGHRQNVARHPEYKFEVRRHQNLETAGLKSVTSHNGRLAKTKVLMKQGAPVCASQSGI